MANSSDSLVAQTKNDNETTQSRDGEPCSREQRLGTNAVPPADLPASGIHGRINSQNLTQSNILSLQNKIGNRAVMRLLAQRSNSTRHNPTANVVQRTLSRKDSQAFSKWLTAQAIELSYKELKVINNTANTLEEAIQMTRQGKKNSLTEKAWSGTGKGSVGAGVVAGGLVTGALMLSNPLGWSVGGGLIAGSLTSLGTGHYWGKDYSVEPHPVPQKSKQGQEEAGIRQARIQVANSQAETSRRQGAIEKTQANMLRNQKWGELNEQQQQFEKDCASLRNKVAGIETQAPAMRTLYRKMLDRASNVAAINQLSSANFEKVVAALKLTPPAGVPASQINARQLHQTIDDGDNVLELYDSFWEVLEKFEAVENFQHIEREVSEDAAAEIERRMAYYGQLNNLAEIVATIFDKACTALEQREKFELALIAASKNSGDTQAQQVVADIPRQNVDWLGNRYPNGYTHIIGNSYAAITPAGRAALDQLDDKAFGLFTMALTNGPISDRSTGQSGVKWGKGELKVRRTILTANGLASDLRLTGRVADVQNGGTTVQVLELTTLRNAHS